MNSCFIGKHASPSTFDPEENNCIDTKCNNATYEGVIAFVALLRLRGRSYHVRTNAFTPYLVLFYPSSEGFIKTIQMCLISILVGAIYDCIICFKTPFKDSSLS